MHFVSTLPKAIRLFCGILLTLSFASNLSAQVGTSFEGIPTNLNCTNSNDCNYTDLGSPTMVHALMDNNGIPVSRMSSGASNLGFNTVFTPTRTLTASGLPGPGLTDDQRFGVAGSATIGDQLGFAPPDGTQAFFMEGTDGEVTMTFDVVSLTGTTTPMFSMQYLLDETTWENSNGADDHFFVNIEITNCASATTLSVVDLDPAGIDAVEGPWTTLTADLTPHIGCDAMLVVGFDSDSKSEELGIDNVIFSQGSLAGNTSIVCPTLGAVSAPAVVCANEPFNVTASGLADMASSANMEQDFGIEFKYFGSATSNPYSGGTSLGTVAFNSLTAGGTTAALAGATISAADPSAFIYAVLSPAPSELTCRPSVQTLLAVESPAPAPIVADVNVCVGTSALITPTSGNSASAVQFWSEDFAQNGAGVTGACATSSPASCATNVAPANGQWSITGNADGLDASSDFLQVNGGQLVGQDLNSELCFLSEPIDISSYSSVDFSVFIDEDGNHEASDYIDVNIIIDGSDNLISNWMGMGSATHTLTGDLPTDSDFDMTTVTSTGLSGNMLRVEICLLNNAQAEMFKFDNITLTGTPITGMFNFYDADPGAGSANLLAGPAASFDAGTAERSIWVTEPSAACESAASEVVITTVDIEAPTAVCVAPLDVNITASENVVVTAADIDNSSFDNCATPTVAVTASTGGILSNGEVTFDCDDLDTDFTVTITATDGAGLTNTCSTTVTVKDPGGNCNAAPVARCQNLTVLADATCMATVLASALDNATTPSSDADAGDVLTFTMALADPGTDVPTVSLTFGAGDTDVILTVSDGQASSTCTATVTVNAADIIVNDDTEGTDIGSVVETESITKEYTITNDGTSNLTVTGTTSDNGQFTIEGFTAGPPLAPSATAMFTVRFTPGAGFTGSASATISIASDDCDEDPYTINVTATSLEARVYNAMQDKYYATLTAAINDIVDNGSTNEILTVAPGTYMEDFDTSNKNLTVKFGPLPDPGI